MMPVFLCCSIMYLCCSIMCLYVLSIVMPVTISVLFYYVSVRSEFPYCDARYDFYYVLFYYVSVYVLSSAL